MAPANDAPQARRPLAAARVMIFAQLFDDPSARPKEFPTQELQDVKRKRLFDLIEKLGLVRRRP